MDHNQWRINFAKKIVMSLDTHYQIDAVVIGGSVARGLADEYSDLEIGIFWQESPTNSIRRDIIKRMGGKVTDSFIDHEPIVNFNVEDSFFVKELQVDLWHINSTFEERTLCSVMNGEIYDSNSLNACEVIQRAIPIYDNGRVKNWKRKIQTYPLTLREKVIDSHISYFGNYNLLVHAYRNDKCLFFGLISGLQKRVFNVLLALNGEYFPTYKRMFHHLSLLSLSPADIDKRFEKMYEQDHYKSYLDMKNILNEVIILLQNNYSSLDYPKIIEQIEIERKMHTIPIFLQD